MFLACLSVVQISTCKGENSVPLLQDCDKPKIHQWSRISRCCMRRWGTANHLAYAHTLNTHPSYHSLHYAKFYKHMANFLPPAWILSAIMACIVTDTLYRNVNVTVRRNGKLLGWVSQWALLWQEFLRKEDENVPKSLYESGSWEWVPSTPK